ncbi:MAG TPA: DUF1361 domain-containing protein [Candidatus Saccharimonadales bacterium]|nr:DUF1361 domain-containing protein [Candidatus Saccharimonadales bacterium]
MIEKWRSPRGQFIISLIVISLVSEGLFMYTAVRDRALVYDYLSWNLFLAWLPLLFALRLMTVLKRKLWSSWEALATSFLWLIFLPNSFYIISDLIHLRDAANADILYDSVMFISFVFTGLLLGFSSLYLIHLQLRRRLSPRGAGFWVAVTLVLCSAAIYLGRDLRWNSWDILTNPGGLLFDIADRVQHPAAYPHMLLIISAFFILLAGMYNVLWRGTRLFVRPTQRRPEA